MFINYPNNPTGAVANPAFYPRDRGFRRNNNIVVASDFAYGAIGFDGSARQLSWRLRAPKKSEWSFTRCPKPTTWPAGASALRSATPNRGADQPDPGSLFCSLFGGIQEAAAAALSGPQTSVRELMLSMNRVEKRYLALWMRSAGRRRVPAAPSSAGCPCRKAIHRRASRICCWSRRMWSLLPASGSAPMAKAMSASPC